MPKIADHLTPKRNPTEERLRATPFEDSHQMDNEENDIRLSVWRRLTESKIIEELLTKPEFAHVVAEMEAGLQCALNGGSKEEIYKIFSHGKGLKLEINKEFANTLGEHQVKFFQGVVQAGIEGYGALYMQLKGLLARPNMNAYSAKALKIGKKSK